MNFSVQIKNELAKNGFENPCCRQAALSAFLRTAGSIETRGGAIGFSITSEPKQLKLFSYIIQRAYGEEPKTLYGKSGEPIKLTMINALSRKILTDLEILSERDGSLTVELSVSKYLTENDCCKRAYVTAAFLGSGSVTVPQIDKASSTGYHLEFVFSKYATALDFSHLLASLGFMAKLIERKEAFIVYFKSAEELNDLVAYMGAVKSALKLTDLIIKKGIKNSTNRALNCEMSNMTKQIDSYFKSKKAIEAISSTIGLDGLNDALKKTAEVRLSNSDASFLELAQMLGVSKSCLSHRLRKLEEIAKNL